MKRTFSAIQTTSGTVPIENRSLESNSSNANIHFNRVGFPSKLLKVRCRARNIGIPARSPQVGTCSCTIQSTLRASCMSLKDAAGLVDRRLGARLTYLRMRDVFLFLGPCVSANEDRPVICDGEMDGRRSRADESFKFSSCVELCEKGKSAIAGEEVSGVDVDVRPKTEQVRIGVQCVQNLVYDIARMKKHLF